MYVKFAVIMLFIVHFFMQLYKLPCSYIVIWLTRLVHIFFISECQNLIWGPIFSLFWIVKPPTFLLWKLYSISFRKSIFCIQSSFNMFLKPSWDRKFSAFWQILLFGFTFNYQIKKIALTVIKLSINCTFQTNFFVPYH